MYTYIYIYTHTYTYIHTRTHTRASGPVAVGVEDQAPGAQHGAVAALEQGLNI